MRRHTGMAFGADSALRSEPSQPAGGDPLQSNQDAGRSGEIGIRVKSNRVYRGNDRGARSQVVLLEQSGELWRSNSHCGIGIPPNNTARIFEPFFTTRGEAWPVGRERNRESAGRLDPDA